MSESLTVAIDIHQIEALEDTSHRLLQLLEITGPCTFCDRSALWIERLINVDQVQD